MKEVYKLWEHQQRAVDFADKNKDIAMFYPVGTGKTGAIINILRRRFNDHKRYMRTLILAPIAVLQQFRGEFENFSRMDLRKIHAIIQKGKKRVEKVAKTIQYDPNQIIIINYEALLNKDIFSLILEWQPEIVVCDESQMIRNYKSKRLKAVKAIATKAKHTYLMTGSPIANSTMDVFAPFSVMDNGATFGNNFFVFRNKYFRDKNASWSGRANHYPNYVPRKEMEAELNALIYTKAIKVNKQECLTLPDYVRKENRVDLSPEQAKSYKEMERDFITFLKSNKDKPQAIVAELAVTKAMKMAQITGGFLYDADKKPHYFKANAKINELKSVLEQVISTDKVIIWCHYRPEIKMISDLLKSMGIKFVAVDGSLSAKDKTDNVFAFENDESVRAIVGNSALAVGVNLIQASYAIYYSKSYSYIMDEQSAGRNFRGNSINFHEKITRIDIIANNTIDEKIAEIVANKQKISDVVLSWV